MTSFYHSGSPNNLPLDPTPILSVVQLQVILSLLALLEQHLLIAKSNLISASISHPMYGIVQSVRGAFQSVVERYEIHTQDLIRICLHEELCNSCTFKLSCIAIYVSFHTRRKYKHTN